MAPSTKIPSTLGSKISSIFTIIQIIFCFLFVYALLLLFTVPLLLLLCHRFILWLIFKVFYSGKYILFESTNGIHAPDFFASVYTIYTTVYIDGPCDIEILRGRIHKIITTHTDKNGRLPYEKMLFNIVKKFGFYCWENAKENFDINHHIRYFPGYSDPLKIYSECDVFDAAAKLADKPWGNERPRWEILLIPQMKVDDTGKIVSVAHFRLQHSYGDGVSVSQLLRTFGDQPSPEYVFDPVNLPIPEPPIILKILAYLQVFFLGPWVAMRFASHKERHVFHEGPLKGGKVMGRNSMEISMSTMRDLRKYYNSSTTAIQHYAMTGALQKFALRRGLPLPNEILASIVTALLPYPNIYPQNRIMMFLEKFPVAIKDPLERLQLITKICGMTSNPSKFYIPLTSRVLNRTIGIMPAWLIEKLVVLISLSYCISNVPGIKETAYFNGHPLEAIVCTGPLLNGFRYVIGISCYKDILTFGFQSENGRLIKDRSDLNELIREFENEILFLINNMNA